MSTIYFDKINNLILFGIITLSYFLDLQNLKTAFFGSNEFVHILALVLLIII